jgi:hypothetical protein
MRDIAIASLPFVVATLVAVVGCRDERREEIAALTVKASTPIPAKSVAKIALTDAALAPSWSHRELQYQRGRKAALMDIERGALSIARSATCSLWRRAYIRGFNEVMEPAIVDEGGEVLLDRLRQRAQGPALPPVLGPARAGAAPIDVAVTDGWRIPPR